MAHRLRPAHLGLAPVLFAFAFACSTTPGMTLAVSPSSVPGDGLTLVPVTATLTAGGVAAPDGTTVHFSTTDGTLEDSSGTVGANPLLIDVQSAMGVSAAQLLVPRKGHGTLTVTATTSFNGGTITKSQVVTLLPSGGLASSITLTCDSQNVGGLVPHHADIHVLCHPTVLGASGAPIANPSVEAYAEAGTFTWEVDTSGATPQQVLVYTVSSSSGIGPVDVDPMGPDNTARPVCPAVCMNTPESCDAEPCYVDGQGKTHNPRDGVVTLMVAVPGTPGFFDENAPGEPFVDADDDGQQSGSEFYIDVNGDGQYTSADSAAGAMQSTRMVWAQTRIIWSGVADEQMMSESSKIVGTVGSDGSTINNLTVRLNDSNYNKLAATNSEDGFTLTAMCTNGGSIAGNAFGSTIPLSTASEPGILFDPATGGIDMGSLGQPATYRRGTDTNLQMGYGSATMTGNTAASTCTVTAAVSRNYDPGAAPFFDQNGSIGTETATGLLSFPAPPPDPSGN